MKEEKITHAMAYLDDDLIVSAAESGGVKKRAVKMNIAKWGTLAACLCLIISSVILWKTGVLGNKSPAVSETNQGEVNYPKDKIRINKVGNIASQDIDCKTQLLSEKMPYEVWQQEMAKFKEFMGIDFDSFVAKAGDSFSLDEKYALMIRDFKDGKFTDDYSLHDYVFRFSGKTEGCRYTLAVSTVGEPLRDYFIANENPKESVVNGCTMYIQNIEDTYMAQFSHNGINYDIEGTATTLEEFIAFVKGYIS